MIPERPSGRSLQGARRELQEIIRACEAVSKGRFNPFFVDVGFALETLSKYLPLWSKFEDLCLDGQAIFKLSEVISLQSTLLRFQSSTLYVDPELLQSKLRKLSTKRLGEILINSWHPILELEQLTDDSLTLGLEYWKTLRPLSERLARREKLAAKAAGRIDLEELVRRGILSKEQFSELVESVWSSLKLKAGDSGKVEYWSFVKGHDYGETVKRAYYVSFLITYGYAELVKEGDRLYLKPNPERVAREEAGSVSYPIPILREAVDVV